MRAGGTVRADRYIQKPFELKNILQAVQNYRRAVGPQDSSETFAHNTTTAPVESPRVETNTPMLRGGEPTANQAQPTVITNAGAN